jgi:hypothetical protein
VESEKSDFEEEALYISIVQPAFRGVPSVAASSLTACLECSTSKEFINEAGSIWHQAQEWLSPIGEAEDLTILNGHQSRAFSVFRLGLARRPGQFLPARDVAPPPSV